MMGARYKCCCGLGVFGYVRMYSDGEPIDDCTFNYLVRFTVKVKSNKGYLVNYSSPASSIVGLIGGWNSDGVNPCGFTREDIAQNEAEQDIFFNSVKASGIAQAKSMIAQYLDSLGVLYTSDSFAVSDFGTSGADVVFHNG